MFDILIAEASASMEAASSMNAKAFRLECAGRTGLATAAYVLAAKHVATAKAMLIAAEALA